MVAYSAHVPVPTQTELSHGDRSPPPQIPLHALLVLQLPISRVSGNLHGLPQQMYRGRSALSAVVYGQVTGTQLP